MLLPASPRAALIATCALQRNPFTLPSASLWLSPDTCLYCTTPSVRFKNLAFFPNLPPPPHNPHNFTCLPTLTRLLWTCLPSQLLPFLLLVQKHTTRAPRATDRLWSLPVVFAVQSNFDSLVDLHTAIAGCQTSPPAASSGAGVQAGMAACRGWLSAVGIGAGKGGRAATAPHHPLRLRPGLPPHPAAATSLRTRIYKATPHRNKPGQQLCTREDRPARPRAPSPRPAEPQAVETQFN